MPGPPSRLPARPGEAEALAPGVEGLLSEAKDYAEASLAAATRRAYRSDLAHFSAWCRARRLSPVPAQPRAVVAYVVDLSKTRKLSTIHRRLAAISAAHRLAHAPNPVLQPSLRPVLEGLKRTKGVAPEQKAPTLATHVRKIARGLPPTLAGVRDRALLLVGFAGALRRSELVALNVEDVELCDEGLVLLIRRGKTDQHGRGRKVGIHSGKRKRTCPVRALGDWLQAAGITSGPIFRPVDRWGRVGNRGLSDRAVALVVKRHAGELGLDARQFAGHSLRAGLTTSAIQAGVDPLDVQRHTGHASLEMLRRYFRDATVFRGNPTAKIGL
jgi:site-specific recombinase XerD